MTSFKLYNRILFNLQLDLYNYKENVTSYLQLVPDENTSELFSKYKVLLRQQKNSSVALIKVFPEGIDFEEPYITIKQNETFRFFVKASDPNFLAKTHLSSYDFTNNVLVLSNESTLTDGTDNLLSQPIPFYSNSGEYKIGFIVRSGSSYYKAIKPSNWVDVNPVTNTTYWKNLSSGSYVSQADLKPRPSEIDLNTIMIVDIKHSDALVSSHQLLNASKCKEITFKIKLLD